MKKYAWASNEFKLERALGELGQDAPEEDVKARYVALAGLLLSEEGERLAPEEVQTPEVVEEVVETPVEETPVESVSEEASVVDETPVEEAPKLGGKKTTKSKKK